MTMRPVRSLKWRLVWRLVTVQGVLLTLLVLLVVGSLWAAGILINGEDEEEYVDALQRAVTLNAAGQLALSPTRELTDLRANIPNFWFVIRDRQGGVLTDGPVPAEFARIGGALDHISQARLGWQLGDDPSRPSARMKRVDTAAGNVQIITGSGGRLQPRKVLFGLALLFPTAILPNLLVMALATVVATSLVVRRSLAGLDEAAAEAERIDIDQRGARLPTERVPTEVRPLVKAVNDALGRLDEGYERHKRFLLDAAHELRTPIAILQTRLDSLPAGPDKTRLIEDVSRLSTLAEQLLDLQRLNQRLGPLTRVDLVPLARRVAADLAPLAIAAGYDLSFDADAERVMVMGDEASLGRALINLVQNAIEHGGRCGAITIRVGRSGSIEVCDEGPGIPLWQRQQIFEPFHRLSPRDQGAGLGLTLVQEIARLHGGHVAVVDSLPTGACFRVTLPTLAA